MSRHGKIQKKVLQLYKKYLRAAAEKSGFNDNVRNEFRKKMLVFREKMF